MDGPSDLLAHVASSVRDVLVLSGPGGEIAWISPSVERLLGHAPAALLGARLDGLVHPADRPEVERRLAEAAAGTPHLLQFRLLAADGHYRWVDCDAAPVAGWPGASVLALRDEEERHAARRYAEDALLEKERYLQAIFDNALDPIAVLDKDGMVVDANPAAQRLMGGGRDELLGRPVFDFTARGAGERARAAWERFLDEGAHAGQLDVATRAGPRTVDYALVADVLPGLHLAAFRDVSEQLALQARFALTDRLATMGTVAAGVAHELKNPLAYVGANLEFVEEGLAQLSARHPEEARAISRLAEAAREALVGAQRMQSIVRDLKTFTRPDEDAPAAADVHRVLESCVNMAWAEVKRRATLRKELQAVAQVRVPEARLAQVLLNLLVNAAHAIPEPDPRRHEILIATRPLPGGEVEVSVADTGQGMSPEVQARIFDPFFTTKRAGEGTGLGLAICRSIVEGAGGRIEVQSAAGKGTRFRVVLPAVEAATQAEAPRRRRVLVVDDEPLLASAIERALLAEWDVQTVSRAAAAEERLRGGERFDALLCDLALAGLDGAALHQAVEAIDPAQARRVAFLTGDGVPQSVLGYCDARGIPRLEKPFEVMRLRELVRRLAGVG